MEHKDDFKSEGMKNLKKVTSRCKSANYAVEFDAAEHSTSLTCEVYGVVSERNRGFYGRFLWFITPLGLDFIDDHFEETRTGLYWEGTLEDIPTEVACEFPTQSVPYAAWDHPIGHCHGHVWWTRTE